MIKDESFNSLFGIQIDGYTVTMSIRNTFNSLFGILMGVNMGRDELYGFQLPFRDSAPIRRRIGPIF